MALIQYFFSGFSLMAIDLLVGSYEPSVVIHALNNICCSLLFSGEVSALNFHALFIDHSKTMTKDNIALVMMYGAMILWALLYRKKYAPVSADESASEENAALSGEAAE